MPEFAENASRPLRIGDEKQSRIPLKKDLIPAAISLIAIGAICFGIAAARPPAPPQRSPAVVHRGAAAANGNVVMTVNGEEITEREFAAFIAEAPEQMQMFYASPEGRRILADELVKLKALEQEGRRLGVDKDPEVATRLEMTETNIVAGSALRKIIGNPDEQRLRAAYEKEKPSLETTALSHILVAYQGSAVPPRDGRALTPAQAMTKALQLDARLKRGEDFATLARAESDDTQSAANGGSLGNVPPGSLPPDIQKVTSALRPGEVSAPVTSDFGIHLFKAGERQSQPFEAVRDSLAARMQRDEAEAAMERLHKAAKVDLDPKFFGAPKAPNKQPAS